MKEYLNAHQRGSIEISQLTVMNIEDCDLGIQIDKDGKVWICIDDRLIIRFKPLEKES